MAGSPLKSKAPFGACKAVTLKGKPCQCREVYGNGYCALHGGSGESPFEWRKARILKRLRAKRYKPMGLGSLTLRTTEDL